MMRPAAPGTQYDHFQLMRGVACLMVFLNHVAGYLSIPLNAQADAWFAPMLVPLGFPWVWLFLVLSGFLLTKAFVTKRFALDPAGIVAFYSQRARRLFPLMWCVLMLWSVLYFLRIWSDHLPQMDFAREGGIALAFPWIPYFQSTQAIASVNSPIWSAVIEIHYCVLMPLILAAVGLSFARLAAFLLVWIAAMAGFAVSVVANGQPEIFPFIYGGHLYNAGFFIAGMTLALCPSCHAVKRIPWWAVLMLAGVGFVGTQYASYYELTRSLAILPLALLPLWCLLVARADDHHQAKLPSSLSQIWGGTNPLRWLELVGIMSYSVYLSHKPLSYVLIDHLHLGLLVSGYASFAGVCGLCFLLLLPIFALLNIGVELRFRRAHWLAFPRTVQRVIAAARSSRQA
jgi:peptidoglycan/LPS O-acetylase OafA/YrhL